MNRWLENALTSFLQVNFLAMSSSLTCNFSRSVSDCSYLFDGVEVYVPIIQALFSALIIAVSVPVSLLLLLVMKMHYKILDRATLVAMSLLASNAVVAVFFSGEIFVTCIARAWVFGFWGCQTVAFITTFGLLSRWILGGLVACDRFCRTLYSRSYLKFDKVIIVGIITKSCVIASLVLVPLYFIMSTGFTIAIPGCIFLLDTPIIRGLTALLHGAVTYCAFWGSVLPPVLYAILYYKSRRGIHRVGPTNQNTYSVGPDESQKISRRMTLTYLLMYINFIIAWVSFFGGYLYRRGIESTNATPSVRFGTTIILSTLAQTFVIGDVVILLLNKDIRNAVYLFLHFPDISRLFCRFVIHSSGDSNNDPTTTTADQPATNDDPIATNDDPIATSDDPIATSDDPIATSDDPIATSDDPIATNDDPIATNDDPIATSDDPIATSSEPIATNEDPIATSNNPRLTRDDPLEVINVTSETDM